MQEHFSVPEAARYMNMSVRFIRRIVAERRIRFYHVGRFVRFKKADLDAFIDEGRVEPITTASVWRDVRGVA